MTSLPKELENLMEIDYPKLKPTDPALIDRTTGEVICTIAQYEKQRAIFMAKPFPDLGLLNRVYYSVKRAVLSCLPESYFFNRR